MTVLRLHDRSRRPPEWMAHLSATQVAVFLNDVKSHVQLDLDGRPVAKQSPSVCYVFDSLADAERFCQAKVTQIEHLLCEIYDRRGKSIRCDHSRTRGMHIAFPT